LKFKNFRYLAVSAVSAALAATLLAQDKPAADKPVAPPVDPAKIVLMAGDVKMTAGQYNDFIAGLPEDLREPAKGAQKRRVAEDLLKMRVMAVEARKRGLDQTPQFKAQMEMMRDNALAGLFFNSVLETLVTDDDVKAYYGEHKNDFERVTARHILISTSGKDSLPEDKAKAKAEEIKKRLDKGEDFAAIAKAESGDPGSKDDGGDLPAFSKGQMLPEFDKAAFSLKPGDISDPVQTRAGFHIIQVKKREVPPLDDDVKKDIIEQTRPQKLDQMVEELKKKYDASLDEGFFGPPAPPAPAK
jgi:peptidyl-prolyl cis-trans isomerase C